MELIQTRETRVPPEASVAAAFRLEDFAKWREQAQLEKIEHGLAGDLLDNRRLHEGGGGVVLEMRAGQMRLRLGKKRLRRHGIS